MKKQKNIIIWLFVWILFSILLVFAWDEWLIWKLFVLDNSTQTLKIKDEAFENNSINAATFVDWSISNSKIVSIDASKITGTFTWSVFPSSLFESSLNADTLSWKTVSKTLTNDNTKIPTSKAIYDKISTLIQDCSTTTIDDYSIPNMKSWETIVSQKSGLVIPSWWTYQTAIWHYSYNQTFYCLSWVITKKWTEIISDLYCNPGYWPNWTTNSCSEVGVWYYSTWWINRTACTNKPGNAIYTTTKSTSSTCDWSCNSSYVLYSGSCVLDCSQATVWSYCWNSTHWFYWYKATSSLILESSHRSSWISVSWSSIVSSYCTSNSSWWYSNWRLPTKDEWISIYSSSNLSCWSSKCWTSYWYWSIWCSWSYSNSCLVWYYYFTPSSTIWYSTSTTSSYWIRCVRSI